MIHDVTCGFRLVSFTAQNLISRGLLIFGRFCKPPRNVVTETSAEPSANWEVSSNRSLTGQVDHRVPCKCQISDSLCMVSDLSVLPVNCGQELLIFRQFCKALRNFVTKTFQSCSQRVAVMEVCKAILTFLNYDFATCNLD